MEISPLEALVFRNTPEGNSNVKVRSRWPFPEPEPAHKREPKKKTTRFSLKPRVPGIIVK